MTLDFTALTQLQPLFKLLSSGAHLNRLKDTELWVELESFQSHYEALFATLGFILVVDGRGFAYFKTELASSYTGKLTRRLALLIMLLFEYQADQGLHLFQFQQWRLDTSLIDKLWQQYTALFEAEEINTSKTLTDILDSAARVGFLSVDDDAYYLLPAIHRYLDLFEELAQAERTDHIKDDLKEDKL